MEQAIRHPDGTMITAGEWSAIKSTARMVKADLLALPPPRDRRAKDRPKTKTYFRTFFSKDWDAALEKMEQHQPLLALCAAHWKADHVLGNTLLVKLSSSTDDESDDEPMDADKLKTQESSEKKKRPASKRDSTSREAKRKKRKGTEQASRSNTTAGTVGIPGTAVKEPIGPPNTSTTESTNPSDADTAAGATAGTEATGTSAPSGSAATTEAVNMLNTSGAAAGDTAAGGSKAVDTAAAGTAAVGLMAMGTKVGTAAEAQGAVATGTTAGAPDAMAKIGSLSLLIFATDALICWNLTSGSTKPSSLLKKKQLGSASFLQGMPFSELQHAKVDTGFIHVDPSSESS